MYRQKLMEQLRQQQNQPAVEEPSYDNQDGYHWDVGNGQNFAP